MERPHSNRQNPVVICFRGGRQVGSLCDKPTLGRTGGLGEDLVGNLCMPSLGYCVYSHVPSQGFSTMTCEIAEWARVMEEKKDKHLKYICYKRLH